MTQWVSTSYHIIYFFISSPLTHATCTYYRYIGKKHLQTAMQHVLSNPLNTGSELSFSVLRVPFLLEPDYDESKPYIESNRDRLVKKWGGKQGWERQKRNHEYVFAFVYYILCVMNLSLYHIRY